MKKKIDYRVISVDLAVYKEIKRLAEERHQTIKGMVETLLDKWHGNFDNKNLGD
jgi:hypothetical protein